MDLSEMTRLESKGLGVKPGEVVSINTTQITTQLIDELCEVIQDTLIEALRDTLILGSFPAQKTQKIKLQKLSEDPDFMTPPLTRAAERALLLKLADALEAERALLLKLADALEAEPEGQCFVQVRGVEHKRTVNLGHYCTPLLPSLAECTLGSAAPDEAATIQVKYHERLVHYVCALGKIGMVLGDGRPRSWRTLGISADLFDLIARLNDQKRLSFAEIAAVLRDRAARLREAP